MDGANSDFYKYIYPTKSGYRIMKNGENYGHYLDLTDALYDRDDLISCNWDIEEWVWIQPHPNKYKDMMLPPFQHPCKNIYLKHGKYRVEKTINGVRINYGTYEHLNDAIKRRKELMESEWK